MTGLEHRRNRTKITSEGEGAEFLRRVRPPARTTSSRKRKPVIKERTPSSKMPSTAPWIAAPMSRSRRSCAVSAWKLKRQRSKRRQREKTTREAKPMGRPKSSAENRWLILVTCMKFEFQRELSRTRALAGRRSRGKERAELVCHGSAKA